MPLHRLQPALLFGIAEKYLQRLPVTNAEEDQAEELDHDPSQGGLWERLGWELRGKALLRPWLPAPTAGCWQRGQVGEQEGKSCCL